MTTPENPDGDPTTPDEDQTPDNPDMETPKEATPKKTTRRTRRTGKKNDAETLKDTQKVNEQMSEQLGASVSPGRHLYQTSQFDVQSQNPSVLNHLAYPSEAAVKAQEAADNK